MVELDQLKDDAVLVFAYLSGDAQQFIARVNNLARNYRDHPGDLRDYLLSPEDTPLLNGLVTSAYARVTGDHLPMLDFEYGGLGVTASKKGKGIVFDANQLHFARLGGTALRGATFRGNSGYCSENSGQAGQGAYVSENAMKYSRNYGDAFMYSTLDGCAFADSYNAGRSLLNGKYLGTKILQGAVNHPELQKALFRLSDLVVKRKAAREVISRTFPPRSREAPEGARMLPGFAHLYIAEDKVKIDALLDEAAALSGSH